MSSKNISKLAIFVAKLVIVLGIVGSVFIELPIFQKNVAVSIDGVEDKINVSGLYGSDIITALDNKLGNDNYIIDGTLDSKSFISDINKLGIKTKKIIQMKLINGAKDYVTFVPTLKDLMNETNLTYTIENEDVLNEFINSDVVLEEKMFEENFAVEIVENPNLDEGTENVLQEGRNKKTSELYVTMNGTTEKIGTSVLEDGITKIIEKGTKVASNAPAVPSDSIWDQLAYCESGGRWNINTGNGYYGGLQFSAATWRTASRAVGLNIEYAHLATREEQIMAATWLQNKSGWGQWPHCSRKLGLI